MEKKRFRFKVSSERVNSHGTWLLNTGARMGSFKEHPVMLFEHFMPTGKVDDILALGHWEDLTLEADGWYAYAVFSASYGFAQQIQKMVEDGAIRCASVGCRIWAVGSTDKTTWKEGQTLPCVTDWEPFEMSIVILPSNLDAIKMTAGSPDEEVTLLLNGQAGLPSILTQDANFLTYNMKRITLALNLSDGATEDTVVNQITALLSASTQKDGEILHLKNQLKAFEDAQKAAEQAQVEGLLDAAVAAKKITLAQKPQFKSVLELNFVTGKSLLDGMSAQLNLSDVANTGGDGSGATKVLHLGKTFRELQKENSKALEALKLNNIQLFKQLYKSDMGRDWLGV